MCPDKTIFITYSQQRGFLLPLALFILVVMGVLALTISRTSIQTQTSSIQEFTNVQAFYAAESGAQRGMQALFLPNGTRQVTDQACINMAINQNFATINGLRMCTAVVTCSCRYQNGNPCAPGVGGNYGVGAATGVARSFYTLTSDGACGATLDQYRAVRRIEVGSFMEEL